MNFNLQPFLENDLVVLRPLMEEDFEELLKVASDPKIWEQHPDKTRWTQEGFTKFFEESLASKGALLILEKESEKIIGSSRFKIIDAEGGVIEIGWTFLARDYWGGKYNGTIKKLMVNYALGLVKSVVFYVGKDNFRSQKAVEKLGGMKIVDRSKSWVLPKDKGVTFIIDERLA